MKMQSCHFSMWTFLSICIHSVVSFTSLCIPVFPWKSLAAWRYTMAFRCQSTSLSISPLCLSLFRANPSPSHSRLSCLNLAFKHHVPCHLRLVTWQPGVLAFISPDLDPVHCHLVRLGYSVLVLALKWSFKLNSKVFKAVKLHWSICVYATESPRPAELGGGGGKIHVSGPGCPSTCDISLVGQGLAWEGKRPSAKRTREAIWSSQSRSRFPSGSLEGEVSPIKYFLKTCSSPSWYLCPLNFEVTFVMPDSTKASVCLVQHSVPEGWLVHAEYLLNKRASFSSTHRSSAYHCSTREGQQGSFKLRQKTYDQEMEGRQCDRRGAPGAWWPGR